MRNDYEFKLSTVNTFKSFNQLVNSLPLWKLS